MYNNPNRVRNIELPENLFSNLGERKKINLNPPKKDEYKIKESSTNNEIKLTNYSNKQEYRDRISRMYEGIKDINPIDGEIDNILYFNNYVEKGIVIKPKVSSLKQFWTEYRLIKNEKRIPHHNLKSKDTRDSQSLNNFDELFAALSTRVTEINKYIDELKEMRNNIDISNTKLEEDREKLKEEKKKFMNYKEQEENKINKEKETLKINYDRLQTIIDDLDRKLNEIEK